MMSENARMLGFEKMLTLRPGSQAHRLVTTLAITGEYPVCTLKLLGNERVNKRLDHRLTSIQEIRNPETGERITTKLLQLSGRGSAKSVRFYKGALPILEWIHPDACRYYMESFWGHRFPGDAAHRDRNLRVAEAMAMCAGSGIESCPYALPKLQNREIRRTVPGTPVFYLARDIKKISLAEQNKTMFARMVGALFYPGGCYAVYNSRSAAMKWNGMGEFKALHNLIEVARMNASLQELDSAVLFGESGETALQTLLESEKSRRLELRFDGIYRHVHFIPMNADGMRRLRMLTLPDWNERLMDLLFEPGSRSYNKGFMEYDACVDGVYIFSHLDGDLARLIRFREAVNPQTGRFEVLCFPDQVPLLREYLAPHVTLKTIDMDSVEAELGAGSEELLE